MIPVVAAAAVIVLGVGGFTIWHIVKNRAVPEATGAEAKIDGISLLGKTGTAEIKESQGSSDGIERGWFICETAEDIEKPVAVVGMVEDVKGKGGSHYVTGKVRNIVAAYEGR